jgi:hypothetical protein
MGAVEKAMGIAMNVTVHCVFKIFLWNLTWAETILLGPRHIPEQNVENAVAPCRFIYQHQTLSKPDVGICQ